MDWADVLRPPSSRVLRQFAGLWLAFFSLTAAWRFWHGDVGMRTDVTAALSVIGVLGLAWPMAVRWLYTGAMIVAFPIGWVVSQLMLAIIFYVVFAPVALVFRIIGRDALGRRRHEQASYWAPKPAGRGPADYLRQS